MTTTGSRNGNARPRYELWIDGCGGFLLAPGKQWILGRISSNDGPHSQFIPPLASDTDHGTAAPQGTAAPVQDGVMAIRIQADLPRCAGRILRQGGDYFWTTETVDCRGPHGELIPPAGSILIGPDSVVPVAGSARIMLRVPSPLSQSAILHLEPPHRFAGHVDRVILVGDSVLIGPGADCHIRCDQMDRRIVLTHSRSGGDGDGNQAVSAVGSDRWRLVTAGGPAIDLEPACRVSVDDVSMTLVES